MITELGGKGEYRELLKIDFVDNEEYKKFVKNLAECVAEEMQFSEELAEDIACEIAERHVSKLAEAVLKRLIAEFREES